MGVVIGVLLLTTLAMPVISDATTTEKTFDNTTDAMWQVEHLDSDSEYTFVWDHTSPTTATANGETVNLTNGTVICATDSFLIRYGSDSTSGKYLQSVGTDLAVAVGERGTNMGDITITISSGVITATTVKTSTTTTTDTFEEGWGIVAKGDYVMKSPNQNAYVLDDSTVFAMGVTTINNVWNNMFQITGTVEGVEVTQLFPSPATYTISDVTIDSADVDGYEGLHTIKEIKFLATNISDSTIVKECTYNFFIVPATVTAELSQHLDNSTISLLAIIPLLITVGIIMAVVGVFVIRRE